MRHTLLQNKYSVTAVLSFKFKLFVFSDFKFFKEEIIDHREEQYSEVRVSVSNKEFDKAYAVMKKVIEAGPPKE